MAPQPRKARGSYGRPGHTVWDVGRADPRPGPEFPPVRARPKSLGPPEENIRPVQTTSVKYKAPSIESTASLGKVDFSGPDLPHRNCIPGPSSGISAGKVSRLFFDLPQQSFRSRHRAGRKVPAAPSHVNRKSSGSIRGRGGAGLIPSFQAGPCGAWILRAYRTRPVSD